jgi:hypothetical protein
MTPEDRSRAIGAGYLPTPLDPGRLLAPDGLRLVTVEQAVAELARDAGGEE